MNAEQIFSILNERYGFKIAHAAVFPEHFGIPTQVHARGSHAAANGEQVEFYINIDEDNIVESCFFSASASGITIASAEAICRLSEGSKVDLLHRIISEDAIIEFFETDVNEGDVLGVFLALEAFKKCLLNLIPLSRDPWKRFYTR